MGIPSLTKYLEDRSKQYFEKYELYNCSLVIDGHNLCNNLYNWQYAYWNTGFSTYCYGGDYDKYSQIVKCFFQLLFKCNVTPYIVFDGCHENDKVLLIKQRLNEKVKINSEITPDKNHPTYAIGAVALRYAFRDVLIELQLKAITCISDANRKMTCLAKHFKCPILSSDSDFFVSSSMFIPFSSIDHRIKESGSYKSVACKIFKIENLINALNKRTNMHYLIPVLLGNNQFRTEIFDSFFKRYRISGGRQKKVDGIFHWLKRQVTLEGAINEIMKNFDQEQKGCTLNIIKHTITGYTPVSIMSELEYFDIETSEDSNSIEELPINFEKLAETFGLKLDEADIKDIQVAELFEKKFTECQYPAFFIDMLKENRYFVWPNIEDCSKPDANSIGYNIMSAIHNILVQTDEKQLTVLKRSKYIKLEEFLLPRYKDQLPSIEEIEYLRLDNRQALIFEVLEIDQNFSQIFESLPKEWHLFVLSLKYGTSKSKFHLSFIYSLIFCFITLNYVDSKLKGFYRSTVDLFQITDKVSQNDEATVGDKNLFPTISERDSFIFMQKVVKYFQKGSEDNAKTYDRSIMHSAAEIQCVFLHLKYFNTLLNYPFEDAFIYKIFDGSFIYNMTKNLARKTKLRDYFAVFLEDCRSIHSVLFYVTELLEKHSIVSE